MPSEDSPQENEQDISESNEEATLGGVHERLTKVESLLSDMRELQDKHTSAVNSFGEMLNYIVTSVSEVASSFKSGGVGGLMKLFGGKSE